MSSTQLFVYGTLRHDQPGHARYCRGVTGWRPARVGGRLWRIPEGYLLLEVPPEAVLLRATSDPEVDETARLGLSAPGWHFDGWPWMEGELLAFRDASEAWPPIDEWEGFVAGRDSVYPRCVVPVEVLDQGEPVLELAWVYAAVRVPAGSRVVE